MKKILFVLFLLIVCGISSFAQKAPYNVVFDLTSADTVVHKMVLRWINEIKHADPNAKIEVVLYAKSLDLVTADKSTYTDSITKYAKMNNVAFKVCEVAMKNNQVNKSQLLPGVQTVPDGIYEIISKQHEGWGYIKAAK